MEKCVKPVFEGGTCQLCCITKCAHLPEVKQTHEEKITGSGMFSLRHRPSPGCDVQINILQKNEFS